MKNRKAPRIVKQQIAKNSSAAEYLTFIAEGGAGSVEIRYEDETIWLTQKMMATVYGVDVRTINEHIKKIFSDGELTPAATIRNFRIVQQEGARRVAREMAHYNLAMVIAVGFKVNNQRAVAFRKWANNIVQEYTIKGFVIDDNRLKNGAKFTKDYFDELLERIREIRASERRAYQKVTDIYATAADYDGQSKTTRTFFATVQNKLHFAVHRHTASEVIMERADANKPNMGLTTWSSPNSKIIKKDVVVAKNYLSEEEIDFLNRLVTMYLDYAELQAKRNIPMTMEDWAKRLDGFIEFNGREVLIGAGKISKEQAKLHAESEFEKYRVIQDQNYKSDFDRFMEQDDSFNELVEKAEKYE